MNIPQLRFPEFQGEWEKKKLSEVTNWASGGTPRKENAEYWNGDIPWISASSMKGIRFFDSELKITNKGLNNGSKLAKKGSLLILVRGSMLFNKIPIGIAGRDVAFNQDVKSIAVDKTTNPYYILQWFISYEPKIMNLVTGTGIGAGKLDLDELKAIKISYPSLPEQTKIASFLTAVDEKIQSLKKKHHLLEQYKKGVMQKLFSQEIRFKDKNGEDFPEWEVKKLGEVFFSEKGKGISKNKIVENGKYECILYGELYTKYYEVIYNISSKTNENDGLKSKIGDLLIPSSTTTTGIDLANFTALNRNDVLLGGDITVLRSKEKINNVFYAYYFSNHKKDEIASYAQGSTIVHLYYNHIKDMFMDLPCFEEQTTIANFLSTLDEKINQTQRQIEKTEMWKKGLLQKMFC